ncbi:thioredoxin [Cryptosporidium sp. chipmunk genotype I]|uniref:thioredoxin n=1 Tax=Cryptosporidium sp. chipmunk genotype I TaxID=1280935 RepID=UPI00351A2529|nr:thioredoxin [Cryptosporidium sp. chipmunk genotype I]
MKGSNKNSIIDFIQKSSIECLNENRSFPFKNALFQTNLEIFCSSLDDHELLAKFRFVQPVNLTGISFKLLERDAIEGFGPKKIKIFADTTSYNIGDAETENCTQEFEVSKSQLITGECIDLKIVKFKNVNFIQIYFSENHGSENTRIGKINIYGEKGDYVDISKWKPYKEENDPHLAVN